MHYQLIITTEPIINQSILKILLIIDCKSAISINQKTYYYNYLNCEIEQIFNHYNIMTV